MLFFILFAENSPAAYVYIKYFVFSYILYIRCTTLFPPFSEQMVLAVYGGENKQM